MTVSESKDQQKYTFPSGYEYEINEINEIKKAMMDIESKTCIKFHERKPEDAHYIKINKYGNVNPCAASQGMQPYQGGQSVFLGESCFIHGIIIHEEASI